MILPTPVVPRRPVPALDVPLVGGGRFVLGEEPERVSEPGVFLVRPDGTLYHGAVQTMPFARPHFDELLPSIDFVLQRNYPARGEDLGPA